MTAQIYPRAASRTEDREPNGVHHTDIVGLRVLVLEDDPLFAMVLEGMLQDLGCRVLGPFSDLDDATAAVQDSPELIDIAILDINIHGEMSYALAAQLSDFHIPFFFCTGYEKPKIEPRWRNWPNIGKFFTEAGLVAMLDRQLEAHHLTAVRR